MKIKIVFILTLKPPAIKTYLLKPVSVFGISSVRHYKYLLYILRKTCNFTIF